MKIKNLYINKVTKITKLNSNKSFDDKSASIYIATSKEFENEFDNLIKEELVRNGVIKDEKEFNNSSEKFKFSTQLISIRKFPTLDNFIRQNIDKVDRLGKALLVKEDDFKKLLSAINYNPEIKVIHIMFDSNTVFCKIVSLSKEKLSLALAKNEITQEKYDELIKVFD
jgi:hypothetical protein